ncbi:uncharacterized protein LOC113859387 [Abrus precatorius]|uniref:Uncharacterized protein LOC113859387 n=1 Tax=Abrus precatorius TaxID=3816 RepID=A0A8B8KXA4_ABRPR|nr:uncharacterized protein LOC113859387 [Abrus precatorius]
MSSGDPKIIHRDVKATNIWLDDNCEKIVRNFGLVKLLDHKMITNVDNNESKFWPDSVVKAFIDIMVDETTKGNMSNETNTITVSEEVWKNYLRVHDKAAQFQKKRYDHYKLLGMIFNRSTATGVLHHSSTQDPPNTDEKNKLESQYLNSGSYLNVDNNRSDDNTEEVERISCSGKRKIQVKEHKSRRESRTLQMGEALTAWVEASKAKVEKYKIRSMKATSSLVTPDYSITKCTTALEEIEGIPDDIYVKALEKIRKPD